MAGLVLSEDDWPANLLGVAPGGGGSQCSGSYNRAEAGYPGDSLIYRKTVHREPCGDSMPDGELGDTFFFSLKAGGAGIIHRWIRDQGGFSKTTITNPSVADVDSLFDEYGCITCHGTQDGFDAVHLDLEGDISAALVGIPADSHECEDQGILVVAGDANASLLYQKVSRTFRGTVCGDSMPFGATMDEADAQTIANWINNM